MVTPVPQGLRPVPLGPALALVAALLLLALPAAYFLQRYRGGDVSPGNARFPDGNVRAGPTDHPIDVDPAVTGRVPVDSTWDPNHGDFSGTRLWNAEGTGPGNLVKCLTCHSPHGAQPGTEINTISFSPTDQSYLPLCANCHRDQTGE